MKQPAIRFPVTFGVLSLVLALPGFGRASDFRNVTWGMTQQQVKAAEAATPAELGESDGESDGEAVLRFEAPAGAELRGQLLYIFRDNKLVRAKYISRAEHEDPNDFIVDFAALEPQLLAKYGAPASDVAVWENDLYQQERLPYLLQDRAHASDILPSDRVNGLSVSMGYLTMYTQRSDARTRVVHTLSGGRSRIVHQIEYRSIELEKLESVTLQSTPRL
jgi:hypothetical protein